MAKDYKNSRVNHKEEKNRSFPFLGGLVIGLLCAGAVYLFFEFNQDRENNPVEPIETEEEIVEVEPVEEEVTLLEENKEETVPVEIEPEYDFYKILPNMEVNVSEWDETEQASITSNNEKPGIYVLQVGSFRKLQAADEVKAKLALLGISADIQRVVINGQDIFHRVRIGPYKTAKKLEETQSRLLNNELDFKLLKLTVEDQ